ncbi:hypothetical protein J6590_023350 [Homalodisca vitripennis]|nr:hypothetical protein J6590_023350 [Homalodisca vitripennis]
MTLCINGKSKSLVEERTFVEINNCVQHFNSLNLKTKTSKTNVINFAQRPVDSECGPAVMVSDSILEEVYSSKFLGIHLDRGLPWTITLTRRLLPSLDVVPVSQAPSPESNPDSPLPVTTMVYRKKPVNGFFLTAVGTRLHTVRSRPVEVYIGLQKCGKPEFGPSPGQEDTVAGLKRVLVPNTVSDDSVFGLTGVSYILKCGAKVGGDFFGRITRPANRVRKCPTD